MRSFFHSLIGKAFQWFAGADDLPHPFLPDLPDVAADVEDRPVVDLEHAAPAFADAPFK